MPSVFAGASCVVLASLPTKTWEEQFGLVLAEALAAGAPVIASSSGAIPEVLEGSGAPLFTPGRLARARAPARGRPARGTSGRARRLSGRGRPAVLDAGGRRKARVCLRPRPGGASDAVAAEDALASPAGRRSEEVAVVGLRPVRSSDGDDVKRKRRLDPEELTARAIEQPHGEIGVEDVVMKGAIRD